MNKFSYFHILREQDDLYLSTCKVIKEYYHLGNKIIVLCDDKEQVNNLDKLLWTFEQVSFIPHTSDINYDPITSVLLLDKNYANKNINKKDYNVILNLTNDTILDDVEIIIEIVGNNNEQKKISREKYHFYKKNNIDVRHNSL